MCGIWNNRPCIAAAQTLSLRHPLAHHNINYGDHHNINYTGDSNRHRCVYLLQTNQQQQVLSYPDGEQFLNVARNQRSPFYSAELAVGEWKELPALASVSKL